MPPLLPADALDPVSTGHGTGQDWMMDPLGVDCVHAIGSPCPDL